MAKSLHLLLLLLLLSTLTPPTTPLPSQPAIQTYQQLHNILEALMGANDFSNWASVLSTTDPSTFPITATLFVPNDESVSDPSLFNPSSISYHIVPQQLSFSELLLFQTGSRLPTLLPDKSILVTNDSRLFFTIDDVPIVRPDFYINGAVSVHGIGSVLNYSVYGSEVSQETGSLPIPKPGSSSSSSPDSSLGTSSGSGENNVGGGNRHSDAACTCIEFPVILSVVLAVFGFKIHGYYPFR